MGKFPHQPRLAVLGGQGATALFVDEHGGDAEQIEFVGAGQLVLAGLGALVGVDADPEVLSFQQGVNEVVAKCGAVLAAEKDMVLADGVLLTQPFNDVLQKVHAIGGVMNVEGPAQLHAFAIADQGGMLALGIVDGDAHDLFGEPAAVKSFSIAGFELWNMLFIGRPPYCY